MPIGRDLRVRALGVAEENVARDERAELRERMFHPDKCNDDNGRRRPTPSHGSTSLFRRPSSSHLGVASQ
jgi:hypothetical protein